MICETERKYQNQIKSHNSDEDWSCHKCDFKTNSKTNQETHLSTFVHKVHDERKTAKYTCTSCDFQTNTKTAFDTHVCRAKQTTKKTDTPNDTLKVNCTVCEEKFSNKKELNTHKLKSHKSWKQCNKFFSTDSNVKCRHNPCHFIHTQPSPGMSRCYDCGRELLELEDLMIHRKTIHNAICRLSLTNECDRDQDSCWFNHPKSSPGPSTGPANNVIRVSTSFRDTQPGSTEVLQVVVNDNQDFLESLQVEAPSLGSQKISQMMDHMMITLKSDRVKMFQTMMSQR